MLLPYVHQRVLRRLHDKGFIKMASFVQWSQKRDSLYRIYWLCGSERVLVEEIVDDLKDRIGPSDLDYRSFDAEVTADAELWSHINQFPMVPGAKRLIVIRQADKIKNWEPLEMWLSERSTTTVVFVSSLPDYPRDNEKEVLSHVERIGTRGRQIRCSLLSVKDTKNYVRSRLDLTEDGMDLVLSRTQCSAFPVTNFLRKTRILGVTRLSVQQVAALVPQEASGRFIDALLSRDKPSALATAPSIPTSDVGRLLGLLEKRVRWLDAMYQAFRRHHSINSMVAEEIVPRFAARELEPYVRHYAPDRIKSCLTILRLADELLTDGQGKNALLLLTALW